MLYKCMCCIHHILRCWTSHFFPGLLLLPVLSSFWSCQALQWSKMEYNQASRFWSCNACEMQPGNLLVSLFFFFTSWCNIKPLNFRTYFVRVSKYKNTMATSVNASQLMSTYLGFVYFSRCWIWLNACVLICATLSVCLSVWIYAWTD